MSENKNSYTHRISCITLLSNERGIVYRKRQKKKYKLHIIVLKVKKEKSSMEHNREPNHKFYAAILHFDV